MKRLLMLSVLVLTTIFCFSRPVLAQEQQKIPVLVDGLPVTFENTQPVNLNERILVPFRAIAEALHVEVTWDDETRIVGATAGQTSVRLQIGNETAYRNGTPIPLDVPPKILNGRTLIPLRFFSEAFDCKVDWDSSIGGARIISPPENINVIGFYALGDDKTSSWKNLFGRAYPETDAGNTDLVRELALGWYSLDREGNLLTKSRTGWQRPDGWENVLKIAGEYNLKTAMVVHVTDGDGAISSLLADEAAMTRAVHAIMEEGALYQGVNLDFEGLGYQDSGEQLKNVQDRFSDFIRLLSAQTKSANINLTLTLHAPNSAYKGYDYKALGDLADRIIIMAYDYGSKPEPVSLVRQAVEMAAALVPPEKLILGISAPAETPESIITKIGIAKRYGLDGIALWRLGVITDGMWETLRNTVERR